MNVPEMETRLPEGSAGERAAPKRDAGDMRSLALSLGAVAVFIYLIKNILLPFVVAGIVAYICTPLLNWLARRTGLPRALFAATLFVLLIGAAVLTVAAAGTHLVGEMQGTTTDLQEGLANLARRAAGNGPIHLFGQTLDPDQIARTIVERARDLLDQPDQLALAAGLSLAAIMGTFLTAALLCYFLVGGAGVGRGLLWAVPPSRRPLVAEIAARLDPVLKRYFLGVLVIVIYAVIAAYVGLGLILHIDHPLLLALLTGALETIPIIGSTSAAIIAGLVSLHTATGFSSILAYTLYAVLFRLSIDQIVAPLVLGGAAQVHPVLIIFCFLSGAVLLGIPGVILAVPIALTIKTTLATLYGEQ
jgi:predicted PurR-regulated permease PerM